MSTPDPGPAPTPVVNACIWGTVTRDEGHRRYILIALASVGRGTRILRASSVSVAQSFESATRAASTSCGLRRRGRPSLAPRARAAVIPARVLSLIRARSNSASAPITWKSRRPPAVSVSIASHSETKPTSLLLSEAIRSIRCARLPVRGVFLYVCAPICRQMFCILCTFCAREAATKSIVHRANPSGTRRECDCERILSPQANSGHRW
jgi:hypothetical protein